MLQLLLLRKLISNQNSCYGVITVQDDLLVRVIFDEFVCKKQLADFILAI